MTYLTNPQHYAPAEFRAYIAGRPFNKGWRPSFPTLHNTGVPTLAQWEAMGATPQERWGASLNAYYRGLGWHCFGGEVGFCTKEGIKTFAECAGKDVEVLTPSGYVKAPVRKLGQQTLHRVKMAQVTPRSSGGRTWYSPSGAMPIEMRVTRDHRWPLANGGYTRELKVGDIIADGRFCPDEESVDFVDGVRHGFIYGDGWKERGRFLAGVHGRKRSVLAHFSDDECRFFPSRSEREPTYICTLVVESHRDLKALPDSSDSLDYLSGFVRGWIVADGSLKRGATYKLSNANREPLEWLCANAPYAGVSVSASGNITTCEHGYGAYKSGTYFELQVRLSDRPWRVESIERDSFEDVFCAILPNEEKLFTLANGVLTHNSGPHVVVCPAYIWVLCDPEQDGVSVSCWNRETFGIEMVGSYEAGQDDFSSGDGAKVRDNAVFTLATLCEKFGWDIGAELHFHRECMQDHHACPGSRVQKPDIVQRVRALRESWGPAPTITPPSPHPLVALDLSTVTGKQAALKRLNFDIAVDGDFGSQTTGCIGALQRIAGLPHTGEVDAATADVITKALS